MTSPISNVRALLNNVTGSETSFKASCPAHNDRHPSLSVSEGCDGRALMKCHAGCQIEDVVQSMGLEMKDLYPPKEHPAFKNGEHGHGRGRVVATYDYGDFQVLRKEPKDFTQRRPDGKGGWIYDLKGVKRRLYQLPRLQAADPDATVYIPEGEKDVNRLVALGLVATCNPGGAGKWREEYSESLRGRNVVILPDNDQAGRDHAERVARSLIGVAASIKIVELPDLPDKGDVSDWLQAGGDAEKLKALSDAVPVIDISRFTRLPHIDNRVIEKTKLFTLTRLDALLAEPEQEIDSVVERVLPVGGISLLGAKPKVGKSTLARALSVSVARGEPFMGRATKQGAVVYLALEEKRSEIAKHFRRMGAEDELIFIHVGSAPEEALIALALAIDEHKPVLAIADPILKLVRLKDGNDYAEVSRALEPVIDMARNSGCHIMCVHHLSKGDRTGGDAILGSTALYGAVDTALIMRRSNEGVRTVYSIQRYGDDLPETVVALDAETGCVTAAGELSAIQLAEAGKAVLEATGTETLSEPDIRQRVGGNQTLTAKAIRHLVDDGKMSRSGGGRRNDPYLYTAISAVPCPGKAEGSGESQAQDNSLFSITRLPYIPNRENREMEGPEDGTA